MSGSFLVLVLCLFLSLSTGEQASSDAVTTSAAASPSHEANVVQVDHMITAVEASGISGKEGDVLETTSLLASDSVTSAVPSSFGASSNVALDLGTITTIEGTTAAVSPMKTTDTIEFRVLVGLSCKWVDGNGVERRSRVCPLESTCDLGPVTIAKKSGLDQRMYFCTGEQQLLVSIACRLEDNERVVVLPRCMAGSRCSIGPLGLSYRGRQVRGYFCDARMLPSSSSWTDRGPADTWTASARISQLDRQGEQEPGRSSNLPTFNGGKSENDNKDWIQDGKDHNKDHGKDGDNNREGGNGDDHVHFGPQDREGERYTTTDALDVTQTAETSDRKRVPGTTA